MSKPKLSVQQIKDMHGHEIPRMMKSVLDLGKWMDDVEGRLIREKKLKIVKGKYVWLDKGKA